MHSSPTSSFGIASNLPLRGERWPHLNQQLPLGRLETETALPVVRADTEAVPLSFRTLSRQVPSDCTEWISHIAPPVVGCHDTTAGQVHSPSSLILYRQPRIYAPVDGPADLYENSGSSQTKAANGSYGKGLGHLLQVSVPMVPPACGRGRALLAT